ncbi:polysaccharide biosynthesis tyrosine autokinase [Microbacterium sp. 1P10AE]|uniref:polysaccharide biosynthesis tyrosine autokinase n=1 Tax=Microbacterium sp. 1P10AE TaxID=3132286 RepID=UPI0039A1FC4A
MDLRSQLKVLRAHWLAVVIFTIVGTVAFGGWALVQPKVYAADASGYVDVVIGDGQASSALAGDNLARAKVKSYIDLGKWRTVAQRVIDQLGLDASPEDVVGRVTVTNPIDTVIVNVRAEGASPEAARDLAQAWISSMATEIADLESGADSGDSSAGGTPAVRLTEGDSAQLPQEPSYPNAKLFSALGAFVGLVVGLLYAVVRHLLDRRIRSTETLESEVGVSVVGSIPFEKMLATKIHLLPLDGQPVPRELFSVSEAMRELRTNIQFMNVDDPPRVIVVTSPVPGDGKSTTSSNLAVALAASGQQVYLIDADLRRPRIASYFGLVEGAGLSDILANRASIEDVTQAPGAAGLHIIAAGRIPPNPSELLGSGRMRSLLEHLSTNAIVILDAPPLLAVTDAAVLSTQADGAIVVVSAGKTTTDILRRGLASLRKVGAQPLGIVLNRVPKRRGAYYDYSYTREYYAPEAGASEMEDVASFGVEPPMTGTRRSRRSHSV